MTFKIRHGFKYNSSERKIATKLYDLIRNQKRAIKEETIERNEKAIHDLKLMLNEKYSI
ncbi:hypothetical protein LCGC14_0651170 [marine sediment metagenome]|uniref:Uncharacterized protein n=1 Tax=marine sediment metagenome TaxID=412755 RepID=A0A0F9U4P5_9ZZZZ